jgi:hypothetical protein
MVIVDMSQSSEFRLVFSRRNAGNLALGARDVGLCELPRVIQKRR